MSWFKIEVSIFCSEIGSRQKRCSNASSPLMLFTSLQWSEACSATSSSTSTFWWFLSRFKHWTNFCFIDHFRCSARTCWWTTTSCRRRSSLASRKSSPASQPAFSPTKRPIPLTKRWCVFHEWPRSRFCTHNSVLLSGAQWASSQLELWLFLRQENDRCRKSVTKLQTAYSECAEYWLSIVLQCVLPAARLQLHSCHSDQRVRSSRQLQYWRRPRSSWAHAQSSHCET